MTAELTGSDVYPIVKPRSRGTTNKNVSGNSEDRKRRRAWLIETYRADVDVLVVTIPAAPAHGLLINPEPQPPAVLYLPVGFGDGVPACRCYRCGILLVDATVTVDRIVPGCMGGTYRRDNIRPACSPCNTSTGAALASVPKPKRSKR